MLVIHIRPNKEGGRGRGGGLHARLGIGPCISPSINLSTKPTKADTYVHAGVKTKEKKSRNVKDTYIAYIFSHYDRS